MKRTLESIVPIALVAMAAACGAGAGAPPPAAQPAAAGARADAGDRTASPDARFMQGMIAHHAQALEMAALVPERAARPDLRLLAERIAVSQRDEIEMMRRWLADRGHDVPGPHAHHGEHARMPGMAAPQEMARLAAARGAGFDRLFLELMIRHHEGALTMVEELFATPGAGEDPLSFQIASDVDADQRGEIARMRALLSRL